MCLLSWKVSPGLALAPVESLSHQNEKPAPGDAATLEGRQHRVQAGSPSGHPCGHPTSFHTAWTSQTACGDSCGFLSEGLESHRLSSVTSLAGHGSLSRSRPCMGATTLAMERLQWQIHKMTGICEETYFPDFHLTLTKRSSKACLFVPQGLKDLVKWFFSVLGNPYNYLTPKVQTLG